MINENLTDFIKNIDKLRHLIRYQTAPRNSEESVAEHQFFVTAYVLKLHDYFEFNLEKAMKMALLHDYSEVYISDIPHPIKQRNPELNELLKDIEYKLNTEHVNKEFADWIQEFNTWSSVEGLIVGLSDVLSVISYAKYELDLGNSTYMKQVYEGTRKRYSDIIDLLKPSLKPSYTEKQIIDLIEAVFHTDIQNI